MLGILGIFNVEKTFDFFAVTFNFRGPSTDIIEDFSVVSFNFGEPSTGTKADDKFIVVGVSEDLLDLLPLLSLPLRLLSSSSIIIPCRLDFLLETEEASVLDDDLEPRLNLFSFISLFRLANVNAVCDVSMVSLYFHGNF